MIWALIVVLMVAGIFCLTLGIRRKDADSDGDCPKFEEK